MRERPTPVTVRSLSPPGQVMRILDDGIAHFDSYTAFPGRAGLERATLLCLQMVVEAAEKQEDVESHIRQTATSLMITSMERLLLSINPKTRRPDYLVTVSKSVASLLL